MEIINNFGLDPLLLGAQIVNFLIIFFILKRFAYKPVLDILKKREDSIKEGLRQAEEGKKMLKDSQKRAEKRITDARNHAIELAKGTEENAKRQVEKMRTAAREQIMQEARESEKGVAIKVSELAVDFLQKSMQDVFGEKEQEEMMEVAIGKIKKIGLT